MANHYQTGDCGWIRAALKPWLSVGFAALVVASIGGCQAIMNPVANGIPVRLVPPELLAGPEKEAMLTIPLTLLKQPPPKNYLLAPRDILGIFIEGILPVGGAGSKSDPPVYFPSQIDPLGVGLQPAMGFPIPVREDGTVALPLIDPLNVNGMTVTEATDALIKAYVDKEIFQPNRARVIVTLMQPRRTRVTVVRQEVGGLGGNPGGIITSTTNKRGTGRSVELRAYENDVMTAIRETGGLPGLDVYNEIVVFRGAQDESQLIAAAESMKQGEHARCLADVCPKTIVIPTRVDPKAPLTFKPEDVILQDGDVVFLEARVTELFYAGGLLPQGEYPLPRDYDLDVVEAVAQIRGPLLSHAGILGGGGAGGGNGIPPGLGNIPPTNLTVVRKTPGGGQVAILVDLDRAMRDPRERINVHPSDVLILHETKDQAMARYFSQVFNFSIFSRIIETSTTTGDVFLSVPNP